jgi:hypothetical protein
MWEAETEKNEVVGLGQKKFMKPPSQKKAGCMEHTCHPVNSACAVCDQETSKFFVLCERIHGGTHGCKWSLLKVRDGKYKREHDGAQVESAGRESMLLFSKYF